MRLFSRTGLAAAVLAGSLVAAPVAVAEPSPSEGPPAGSYDGRHLLVTFAPGTPGAARAAAHAAEGTRAVNRFDWLNTDVVEVRDGEDAAEVAPRYARNPTVVNTDLNWRYSIDSVPNDPRFGDLWGLHNPWFNVDVDGPEGWDLAFGADAFPKSGGSRVGILDTGIDLLHEDLGGLERTKQCASAVSGIGVVSPGCYDDEGHGTHVAGTVGAIANNGVGVAGAAPDAEFAIFKALNADGWGFYADVIAGIRWLRTTGGAGIINMSLGGPRDYALDAELTDAAAAGTLLIAAAGNSSGSTPSWPAYHPDVMSVAAVNGLGNLAFFSTCNDDVEINAPGVSILSTYRGNEYGFLSGTSMAAPHVSGVAALLQSEKGLGAGATRELLKSTAQGPNGCNDKRVVNLAAALAGTPPPPSIELGGAIAGEVTSGGKGKRAISGATVDCMGAGRTTTDSNGAYSLVDVPPGSYDCTASKEGYRDKSATVTVQSEQTTTQDFRLQPGR